MSSRPRRSCTLPVPKPILSNVLEQAAQSTDSEIFQLHQRVAKFFKEDVDALAAFWFADTRLFDLRSREHQQLLTRVLAHVGVQHPHVVDFLHGLSRERARALGVHRVERGSTIHYRIRTGMDTNAAEMDRDYDDFYIAL